jgi:hypothetical protein
LGERAGGEIGNAIDASRRSLDPPPLCQPGKDGVGETSLSSLLGRQEAVAILSERGKFVKT